MNLAVNARDAMPQGGKLTIETSNVRARRGLRGRHPGVQPGPYVLLAVTDTGCGMDAADAGPHLRAVLHHQGAARGPAWAWPPCYGIVKQSGGHIEVYSELGHGTRSRSICRAMPAPAEPAKRTRASAAPGTARDHPAGRGRRRRPRPGQRRPRESRLQGARGQQRRRGLPLVRTQHRDRSTCSSPTSSCPT